MTALSPRRTFSGTALKTIACITMLVDHIGASCIEAGILTPGLDIGTLSRDTLSTYPLYRLDMVLRFTGRLAFPIFCFLLVEGFVHTHDFRKYALRLALFAVLSEVPFDLMYGGTWFYPVHQNVIWTLLLGLLGIHLMETVRKKQKTWLYLLTALLVVLIGTVLGTLSMVDYYGTGVLTIFIFYFFRGRKWWCLAGQLLALYWVNVQLLGGLLYPVHIFGMEFEICQQGLALLALLPIWLYRGRQGYHSKPFQYACYAFYPVHMLVLGILSKLIFSSIP